MLLLNGEPLRQAQTADSLLSELLRHPTIISSSKAFKEVTAEIIDECAEESQQELGVSSSLSPSKRLRKAGRRCVYVFQREYATVHADMVDLVGTDDMTTCVAVAIRNPVTGQTSLGHVDGKDCIAPGITSMLASLGPPEIDTVYELHLVGAYDDSADDPDSSPSSDESVKETGPLSPCTPAKLKQTLQDSVRTPTTDIRELDEELSPSKKRRSALADIGLRASEGPVETRQINLNEPSDYSPETFMSSSLHFHTAEQPEKAPIPDEIDSPEERGFEPETSGRESEEEAGGGVSWSLAAALLWYLDKRDLKLDLRTICLLQHNTVLGGGLNGGAAPAVRGLVIEPASGRALPALFTPQSRGPDGVVRGACMMASSSDPSWGSGLASVYDTQTDTFRIGPCRYLSMAVVAHQLLAMPDQDLLAVTSTSPAAEGPDFLPSMRKVLAFLQENPDWKTVFKSSQPRIFVRRRSGSWYFVERP